MASQHSVGSVLRASKLARFDARLPQVYTAHNGRWGAVKARLPQALPATHLTFKALDSKYMVPDLRLADAKVSAVHRLCEMVPFVVPPVSLTAKFAPSVPVAAPGTTATTVPGMPMRAAPATVTNLATLSDADFRAFVATKVPSGRAAGAKRPVSGWADEMHVTFNPARRGVREACARGPVYTELASAAAGTTDRPLPVVRGRIINAYSQSVATVAVGGFVGQVELGVRDSKNRGMTRATTEYEVEELTWNHRGQPTLRLVKPLAVTAAPRFQRYNTGFHGGSMSNGVYGQSAPARRATAEVGALLRSINSGNNKRAPPRSDAGGAAAAPGSS